MCGTRLYKSIYSGYMRPTKVVSPVKDLGRGAIFHLDPSSSASSVLSHLLPPLFWLESRMVNLLCLLASLSLFNNNVGGQTCSMKLPEFLQDFFLLQECGHFLLPVARATKKVLTFLQEEGILWKFRRPYRAGYLG